MEKLFENICFWDAFCDIWGGVISDQEPIGEK